MNRFALFRELSSCRHMRGIYLLVTVVIVILGESSARDETLPSYLTPCPQALPPAQFDQCVTNMARSAFPYQIKGDPSRKIPSLDPLNVKQIQLQIKNPPLTVTVLNGTMYGLKDLDIKSSRTNLIEEHSVYNLSIPRINLVGDYRAQGFFIFMPIDDKGPINITLVDLNLAVKIKFSKKLKKDKNVHMKLNDVGFKVNGIGRAHYYMGNLFKGAFPPLNDQFNEALNADWKSVAQEALPSVSKAFSQMFKSVVGRIMQPYPYNTLFPAVGVDSS